jgi:hypothetical protein
MVINDFQRKIVTTSVRSLKDKAAVNEDEFKKKKHNFFEELDTIIQMLPISEYTRMKQARQIQQQKQFNPLQQQYFAQQQQFYPQPQPHYTPLNTQQQYYPPQTPPQQQYFSQPHQQQDKNQNYNNTGGQNFQHLQNLMTNLQNLQVQPQQTPGYQVPGFGPSKQVGVINSGNNSAQFSQNQSTSAESMQSRQSQTLRPPAQNNGGQGSFFNDVELTHVSFGELDRGLTQNLQNPNIQFANNRNQTNNDFFK